MINDQIVGAIGVSGTAAITILCVTAGGPP